MTFSLFTYNTIYSVADIEWRNIDLSVLMSQLCLDPILCNTQPISYQLQPQPDTKDLIES